MKKAYKILLSMIICIFLISWVEQQKDEFIFQRGIQKLTLELGNGKKNLNWNIETTLILKYKNIDSKKLNFSAPGISFHKHDSTKNITFLRIKPDKNSINNDTLKLIISGRDLNDSIWIHKFKILIK